jgi:hypothetical protein
MFNLELQWKQFNINLDKVQIWIKSNIETELIGISANSSIQLHFAAKPSEEEIEEINEYWNKLKKSSSEAKTYKSSEEIKNEMVSSKQSALNKLKEIAGLTEDEVNALLKG